MIANEVPDTRPGMAAAMSCPSSSSTAITSCSTNQAFQLLSTRTVT